MQINYLTSLSAPISVNLEITDKCNLSCGFCFNAAPAYESMMHRQEQKDKSEKGAGELLAQVRRRRIIKTIDELAERGVFEIRLFGGEFTVFKDWQEILSYIYQKGFFISFVSNGYLIDESAVKLFSESCVRECTISIHGPEETHDLIVKKQGSFLRAMNSVKLLQEAGIRVTIAYTPNASNLTHLYEFVSLMSQEYQVSSFSISRLFTDNRYENLSLKDYQRLLRKIERCKTELGVDILLADSFPRCQVSMRHWQYLGYCSQGVGFAQVDFNGNIKNCSATSETIGNILTEDISDIWQGKLHSHRNLDHLPLSCKMCPIFCGGGCTASRGVEHPFAPDEFIPWPRDETLLQAFLKTVYNGFRKIVHRYLYPSQYENNERKSHISRFPKLSERYRVRVEGEGHLVMFEKAGVQLLTSLSAAIIPLLDGRHDVPAIHSELKKTFQDVEVATVEDIISKFPVL